MRAGRTLDLLLVLGAACVVVAALWLQPSGAALASPAGDELAAMCWFKAMTGLACPFCGLTRSFVALAHGDLGAAFGWHPAGPLLFAALIVATVLALMYAARRQAPLVARRRFRVALPLLGAAALAVGFARMLGG